MGLLQYIARRYVAPLTRRMDLQNRILFDLHYEQLLSSPRYSDPRRLERFGHRSYSQNDEDGILQEIFRRIGIANGRFVEFGVETGRQNNSLFLLINGWRGMWIEADWSACRTIRNDFHQLIESGQLRLEEGRVTPDNIDTLIRAFGDEELDLLSIDVDGNDYWIWAAMVSRPRVIVCEYNAKFAPPVEWVMPYNPDHVWDESDYQGASLPALVKLAKIKGYSLVGCCIAGVNAFFVRNDLMNEQFAEADVAALYNPPKYYVQYYLNSGHPLKTVAFPRQSAWVGRSEAVAKEPASVSASRA